MECSITWDELDVRNGPLWKALVVPPGRYRIKLGPLEVFSTVHSLKLILAINSLAKGTIYLLSSNFEGMEIEDEPDYTTLISSCKAFDGFFLLTFGLPEDFGVTMKRKNGKVVLCCPDDFNVPLPTYSIRKVELSARELGLCMAKAVFDAFGRLDTKVPEGLRDEYLRWRGALQIPGV
ncbi:hypothetical protein [Thermococcus thermotolerans]|uniref:hypothetical protein n=1 Tax=Thermococcus thermotolerans TaxID=2969672 RepID=UPI0021573F7A|nr:hypothetical protein [Thermococcus thermotolerans]